MVVKLLAFKIMKKIYLHIGVHKTGTTSLQQFTRKNHELLSELGLYVPPPGKTIDAQGNEINLGSAGGGLHAIPKSISGKDPYVLNAFLNDFENSQLNSALISSEGFDSLEKNDINFLADLLKNYQVQPVVVFRHPVHLARSIYCSLGRISPVQGTRLIDSKLFFTHPGYLFSKIWPSKEQSSKISRTNFILRQATRRIYDFQGFCRDWSCLGKVKVFLFEQSTNIAEDILQHLLQDNTNSLQAIKDMNIPRLRSSLPVPVAVLNNELYTSLNIDINIYHKHIYPYLVNFSRSKKIEKFKKNSHSKIYFLLATQTRLFS